MEYRTTDIRTGLFVAFSILAATVLVFLMGGIRGAYRDAQEVKFRFPDVHLLELENAVTIGGFRVGEVVDVQRVEALAPDGKGRSEVEVTMMVDKSVRICTNATAMVRQDGFLGEKFVALDPGNSNERHDPSTVLVGTAEVQLSDLMNDFKKPLAQTSRILDEVYSLLSDDDLNASARGIMRETNLTLQRVREVSLPKLEKLTGTMEKSVEELAATLNTTTEKLSTRLERSLDGVDRLTGSSYARTEELQPIVSKTSAMVDDLRAAIADLRTAVNAASTDVTRVSDGVTKVTGGVDRLLTDNNRNIYVMIRQLRDTAATLERVARKVQANPAVLIWGDDEPVPPPVRGLGLDGLRESGRAKPYGKEPGR